MDHHQINIANDESSISACFSVFKELRPHLENVEEFQTKVSEQMKQGYVIAYIKDGANIAACIGYRVFNTLAWGKILYIDDLITCGTGRAKGYGGALLSHAISQARNLGCDEVHLDTGYTRYDAHRVYLNHGFKLKSHHMSLTFG